MDAIVLWQGMTDLSHDFIVREVGTQAKYIKLTVKELPFNQPPCISGLRVFGKAEGELPEKIQSVTTKVLSPLDVLVEWEKTEAVGIMFIGALHRINCIAVIWYMVKQVKYKGFDFGWC